MASPFDYANLAPYQQVAAQQLLAQSQRNPLQEMITAYQAPRIAQQKALSDQLALEIQRANLQATQRSMDPNSPENRMKMAIDQARLEALRRSVPTDLETSIQQATQQGLARQLGVVQAPRIAGQPLALPALPVTPEAQRAILATPDDAPVFDETISPLNVPIQVGPGAVFDPQTAAAMQRQAVQEKQRQALELIDARAKSRGFKTYVNKNDSTDIISLDATERPPEDYVEVAKGRGTGAGGAGGGGSDLKPTGEVVDKFAGGLNILGQVNDTLKVAEELQRTGRFPSTAQSGLNQFLGRRPQDIPGANLVPGFDSVFAMTQRLARGAQTKESRDLQMRKALITSTILRTQAGLSQTLGEAINIAPYVPSENDTYESLIDKLNQTKNEGMRALRTYRRIYPQLASIEAPELGEASPSGSQAPSSERSFSGGTMEEAEAAARKAGFKANDILILNGEPRRLQ